MTQQDVRAPRKRLVADGISLVDNQEFQSFIVHCRCLASRKGDSHSFSIPKETLSHLHLEEEDLLEVAVRKVPFSYAKEFYKLEYVSHRVQCPVCQAEGVFQRFGRYIGSYAVRHSTGKYHKYHWCFLTPTQSKETIARYQANELSKEQAKGTMIQ